MLYTRNIFLDLHEYFVGCNKTLRNSVNENEVIFQNLGKKGVITLNRPKVLNALSYDMVIGIYDVLKVWQNEKSLILIKGVGNRAFSVGGDVRSLVLADEDGDRIRKGFFKTVYKTNALIKDLKIPYIAIMDGMVMGGGVGLSVHGSYRIATERSLFAMPEALIGLVPDVGASYFLSKMPGHLGLFLALTGSRLRGSDLLITGIATHYIDSQNLDKLEQDLLQTESRQQIEDILQAYNKNTEDFSLAPYLDKINHCFAASSMEGIVERLQQDGSKWADNTLQLLAKMSPTSLKVCFQQMKNGAKMNLKECLQMEYRIVFNCCANKNFYEGVRARLIEKDQNPRWSPSDISQVTSTLVDSYFNKLPEDEELKFRRFDSKL